MVHIKRNGKIKKDLNLLTECIEQSASENQMFPQTVKKFIEFYGSQLFCSLFAAAHRLVPVPFGIARLLVLKAEGGGVENSGLLACYDVSGRK